MKAACEEPRREELLTGAERRRLAEMITAKACRRFGKGPTSCKVTLTGSVVTVDATDILTPLEKLLIQAGQKTMVLKVRGQAFKALLPGFRNIFAQFDLTILSACASFDLDNNRGKVSFGVSRA